jgi:hypothetical protein
MTRIFDALKKVESKRERLGLGPVPVGTPPGHDPATGWARPRPSRP